MTKTLFRAEDRAEMLARIARVTPESKARWGKMDAGQMLAHCQAPLRVATGELALRRGLVGILFGKLAKKKLLGAGGFKPGLPTAPEFRVRDARDCARERDALAALVARFGEGGPAVLTRDPHPFFGPLTHAEWEALMWKHLDHHLGQFGV